MKRFFYLLIFLLLLRIASFTEDIIIKDLQNKSLIVTADSILSQHKKHNLFNEFYNREYEGISLQDFIYNYLKLNSKSDYSLRFISGDNFTVMFNKERINSGKYFLDVGKLKDEMQVNVISNSGKSDMYWIKDVRLIITENSLKEVLLVPLPNLVNVISETYLQNRGYQVENDILKSIKNLEVKLELYKNGLIYVQSDSFSGEFNIETLLKSEELRRKFLKSIQGENIILKYNETYFFDDYQAILSYLNCSNETGEIRLLNCDCKNYYYNVLADVAIETRNNMFYLQENPEFPIKWVKVFK